MAFAVFRNTVVLALAVLFTMSRPGEAQWLKYKTPGIPRTADGKPDLTAPALRTADGKPDFSGVWQIDVAAAGETAKALGSIKAQPWAEELFRRRQDDYLRDNPALICMPPGPVVELMADRSTVRLLQTPSFLAMLFGGTLYREVFLDGRSLPEIVNPSWMGYSVGHWDGDTLVIESAGFNDKTWLEPGGHPHTEALHVTEYLRRPDFGHLEIRRTLVDPGALTEPWTVPLKFKLNVDNEPLEYVCNENERDRQHFFGKVSDQKSIAVRPEVLAKYIGSYEVTSPALIFEVSLTGGRLEVSFGPVPKTELKAFSETEFSTPFGNIRFEKDDRGTVTQLIFQGVDGDLKASRKGK